MIHCMEINVLIDEPLARNLDARWLELLAVRVLDAEGVNSQIEMGLVIASQERVQALNYKYLGKDEPTDVIAFHMKSPDGETFVLPPDGLLHLGEVVISYPQAVIQAGNEGHSVTKEIATLFVHGILHLMGYRDDSPDLKRIMMKRQSDISILLADIIK